MTLWPPWPELASIVLVLHPRRLAENGSPNRQEPTEAADYANRPLKSLNNPGTSKLLVVPLDLTGHAKFSGLAHAWLSDLPQPGEGGQIEIARRSPRHPRNGSPPPSLAAGALFGSRLRSWRIISRR